MVRYVRWLWSCGFISTAALGGGMDTGGGGLRSFESNSWFIGSRDVTYCVEVNPNFPVMSTQPIQHTVENAFLQWRHFQDNYHLNQRTFNLTFPDGQSRGINLHYVQVSDCQTAAITVLIGIDTPEVRDILKLYPPKTFAFAHRIGDFDFQHYTRDNRGIIWIAQPEMYDGHLFPPYDKRPILPLVLLHEIGHTLGIGHLDKYSVMSADIFEWMSVSENSPGMQEVLKNLALMDNPTPLVSFGRVTKWVPLRENDLNVTNVFTELVGKRPVGALQFAIVTIPAEDVAALTQKGLIEMRDDNGTYKFDIDFNVGSENTWPFCKIKLAWDGVVPANPAAILSHGCLDSMSSDYLVGQVLDAQGSSIPSKVTIVTRQKYLNSFNGQIRKTRFNLNLKMVGASN